MFLDYLQAENILFNQTIGFKLVKLVENESNLQIQKWLPGTTPFVAMALIDIAVSIV